MITRKEQILDTLGQSGIASVIAGLFPEAQGVGKNQILVKCVYHDEQNPSLSVQTSTGLHNCKSCGASGDFFGLVMQVHGIDFKSALDWLSGQTGVAAPAKHIPKAKNQIKQQVTGTWHYTDPSGNILFSKDRLEPGKDGKRKKDFVYYRTIDNKRVFGLGDGMRYPYRVHTFADANTIYFPEGEAKAELLASWGLCASCLQSGSSKWEPHFNELISGKHLVLMPDNDETGEKYISTIATGAKRAARVKILRLPGLPEKGDVLDWIQTPGNNRELFLALAADAEPWLAPPSKEVVQQRAKQSSDKTRTKRGADVLIPMLSESPLYRENDGTGYLLLNGKLQRLDVGNRELFEELSLLYWQEYSQSLGKEAGSAAVSYYSGLARGQGEDIEFFKRVGRHQGKLYYDLMNGRAVEVSPGSWRIVERPLFFQSLPTHQPQPDPMPGGDIWKILDFIRLAPEQQLLFVVSLVSCFVAGINHPAFAIGDPQGSGKSTTQAIIKMIVDPSTILLSVLPRKIEDVPLLLSRNFLTNIDNQSGFPAELADLFCAAITGGVLEKRVLHTDSDMIAIKVPGVFTYSAITAVSDRPDLHERTIRFTLERLQQDTTMSEARLYKQVAEAVPGILGGVFDVLARAMELQPQVEDMLDKLPRMADYSIWCYAIGQALGNLGAEFIQAYSGNSSLAVHDLLGSNTFFSAIVQAMGGPSASPLQGTFAEVIRALQKIADPDGEQNAYRNLAKDTSFPKSHQRFRSYLERLKVPLASMGIGYIVEEHKTSRGKVICSFHRIETPQAVDPASVIFDEMEVLF